MSNVYKPQRQFIIILFTTLMCFRGKANFRNLSRYSDYNEKTYSRWFTPLCSVTASRRDFDFVEFNNLSLAEISNNNNTLIAAVYCSFINKSGKQTYGLDKFYNGNARQKTVWKYQL